MATNIDPTLRALGSRGRYQLLQLTVISLGAIGAGYQLLDNVFIGRAVEGQRCSPPSNSSVIPHDLQDVDWNSSHVEYSKCHITINTSHQHNQQYDCMFGYSYGYPRSLSFRTEFDLVCERSLLGGFAQSLVILGQGFGAVVASVVSDRYGRKRVLVVSQLGLLVIGAGIGLAPSYVVLAMLKFVVGAFQQGVVASTATMTTELFPTDARRLTVPMDTLMWGFACTSMALVAYIMKENTWRHLQYALTAPSLLFLLQLWYVDESLYWLVANGKKKEVLSVLKRAAKTNKKDLNIVLQILKTSSTKNGVECEILVSPPTLTPDDQKQVVEVANGDAQDVEKTLEKSTEKLTLLDIFRHKRIFFNSLIMWCAWFTCAFAFFGIMMMSTSFVGDRFLNYALIAFMETPPGFIFYFSVNRYGRKWILRLYYLLGGIGLVTSGICRIFEDNTILATISILMAMIGMIGAAGMFDIIFFYTPEIFPTNMRNQALGIASFIGRLGGMLAPFMTDFAEIAIWGPGVLIGSLSFIVVFLFRFLPETQGTDLPQTIGDMKKWYKPANGKPLVNVDTEPEATKA